MKSIRFLAIAALGAIMFTGCDKESDTPDMGSGTVVQFTTSISGQALPAQAASSPSSFTPKTRAAGTTWGGTDEIGVFMLTAGGTAMPNDIVDNRTPTAADNVKYTNSASGFTTATPIYYPQSGNVDFVAYYPYQATLGTPYKYKVSVADQTTPAVIDLLYSNNAKNVARSKTAVGLEFKHALSRVVLNITKGAGMSTVDFSTLGVTIKGMPTTADFALVDGGFSNAGTVADITPRTIATGTTYEAIVIPQVGGTGRNITFAVDGETYTYPLPNTDDFAGGKNYPYTITVKKSGISVSRGAITDWTGTTGTPDDLGGASQVPLSWAFIPAGIFMMGSPANEPGRKDNETQHSVTLTKDFYMSKYQITNAQYAAFLNANGIGSDGKWGGGIYPTQVLISASSSSDWGLHYNIDKWEPVSSYEHHPVIYVTWYGATEYARWIGGSLPTEAQWEYACRAGTTSAYSLENNATDLDNYAWYGVNASNKTHEVGGKLPNLWGLYDMHGNVQEWCLDQCNFLPVDYGTIAVTDPIGTAGSNRVLRGGGWNSYAQYCRSAFRGYSFPDVAPGNIGFRVVFVP